MLSDCRYAVRFRCESSPVPSHLTSPKLQPSGLPLDHREQPRLEKGVEMCQFKEWVTLLVAIASLVLDILKTLKARRRGSEPSDGPDS